MKQKITCFCENSFDVEVPGEIDLDSGSYFDEIQKGTFMNFTCPGCQKKHKPEFPITIQWPSKKLCFSVIPELERGAFYRQKKQPAEKQKHPYVLETLIGYPEMADRLAVINDGLEPVAIEAIKYFLHLKAEEQYPDDEIDIWYYSSTEGKTGKAAPDPNKRTSLEFHIHGIRADEVAVMKIPYALYEKNLDDYKNQPKNELFTSLRFHNYLSVKNTMIPEVYK